MMADLNTTALAAQLLATCNHVIVMAHPAGTSIYWNQGVVDIFGYPQRDRRSS
jgi:hypothetical protein